MSRAGDLASFVRTLGQSVRWMVNSTDKILETPGDAPGLGGPAEILAASGYRSCLALADVLFRVLRDVLNSRHRACVVLMMRRPLAEWYIRARHVESVWDQEKAGAYLRQATVGVPPGTHQVAIPRLDTAMRELQKAREESDVEIIGRIEEEDLDAPVHGGVAVFAGGLPEVNARQSYPDKAVANDIRMPGEISFLAGRQLMRLLGGKAEMLKQLRTRKEHFEAEWRHARHR